MPAVRRPGRRSVWSLTQIMTFASRTMTKPGRAQQLSTRILFFIAGFTMSAWAPLIPFAKLRAGLDEATLGLLLLCLGAGSIIAMPFAGAAAARFGCRRVLIGGTVLVCVALPLLAFLASPASLGAALFLFGASLGMVDCTINIHAVLVERAAGRAMMSGFHGLFSVGGIVGSGGVSLLLMAGMEPLAAVLLVVGLTLLALFWAASGLLTYGSGGGAAFAVPHGVVLFIGLLCFIMFLTEGAMLDWSAVFLTSLRDIDPAKSGLGYAAFSLTMTIGRLTGDRIVRALGPRRILVLGGATAALGLATVVFTPFWLAGLVGFALVGVGCSNIVPVLYSAVGRQQAMPEHTAVAAVSTMGYAGILSGPAAIGFVAHVASLPGAFLMIALLLLFVVFAAPRLAR